MYSAYEASAETTVKRDPAAANRRAILITLLIAAVCIAAFLLYIGPKFLGVTLLPIDPFGVVSEEKEDDRGDRALRDTRTDDGESDGSGSADRDMQNDDAEDEGHSAETSGDEGRPAWGSSAMPASAAPLPVFVEVYTSSTRQAMGANTYDPAHAVDGDWSTAWCEGADGDGAGEWIELKTDAPQRVTGVRILNGYFKSKELYDINNSIAVARVVTDTEVYEWQLVHSYNGFQEFLLPNAADTYAIRIEIGAVSPHGDGLDTLISEIEVF
jgi:hypothetical protein